MRGDGPSRREVLTAAPALALVLAGCAERVDDGGTSDEPTIGYGNETAPESSDGDGDDGGGNDDGRDDDGRDDSSSSNGGSPPGLGGDSSGAEAYGNGYGNDPYGHPR